LPIILIPRVRSVLLSSPFPNTPLGLYVTLHSPINNIKIITLFNFIFSFIECTGCKGKYLYIQGKRKQLAGKNYIIRNFVICTSRQILIVYKNKDGQIGRVCSMQRKDDK
jgi:hypothetical protein